MVYRSPGKSAEKRIERSSGKSYDYKVVDADEEGALEAAFEDGWHGSPKEAVAAVDNIPTLTPAAPPPDDNAPPTRAEMEEKAFELGVVFDDKMKDKTLKKKISEAIETRKESSGEFL